MKKYFSSESIFFLIVALLVLFVRIRYINVPLERDEGEYAYAAQEILRGYMPYLHFYNMKLPGTYYGYALMFWIGGDSILTIKIGLVVINALSTLFIFLITQKMYDRQSAWLSAAVYLIFSLSLNAQGYTCNAEHFVILPALIGVYTAIFGYFDTTDKKFFFYIISGCFLAFAYLCKQHAFGYILFLPLWILIKNYNYKSLTVILKRFIPAMLAYALGGICVIGIFLYYFYQKNAIKELNFYTNKYALSYISQEIPFQKIWYFRPIFWDAPLFWIIQFVTLFFVFYRPRLFKDKSFITLFWFCSFLCIHPGWYYRPHYFQLVFPGAAVITGVGLTIVNNYWRKKYVFFNPSVFRWLALTACIISQFKYFFVWSNSDTLFETYGYSSFDMVKEMGDELKKITKPDDKIALLCAEPQLLFYSQRRTASGFLYYYPLTEKQPFAKNMTEQFIKEVEINKPEIFVFQCDIEDNSDNNKETSHRLMAWYQKYTLDYELIGMICTDLKTFRELKWKHKGYDMKNTERAWFYIYLKR